MGPTERELWPTCRMNNYLEIPDARWFAFTVKPQHEFTVGASLEAKGIPAFVPPYATRRRWSDRTQTVRLPLFPGYVVCRVPFSSRVLILRTPGVRSIVGFGSAPAAIEDDEVESIRRMVSSGLPLRVWPRLEIGQRVRIILGPLCGLEGTLARYDGKLSVVAGIQLLQRSLSVEIEADSVEPVIPVALKAPL